MSATAVQVVWFKRDLRVHDHEPLAAAAAQGPVLPLYLIEPSLWREADAAGRHWSFIRESLLELRQALAELGQPLIVRTGEACEVLTALVEEFALAGLWSHQETGNNATYQRDLAVADWCRAQALPWHEQRQHGVVRRLSSRDGWARRWDRLMAEPQHAPPRLPALPASATTHAVIDPGPIPQRLAVPLPGDPIQQRQTGGRVAGLETLQSFLQSRSVDYRSEMSSPLSGASSCSRLSPYLAWGCVSLREVTQATWTQQRTLKALAAEQKNAPVTDQQRDHTKRRRASLTSFNGRLHWHCHFMQKLEDEPALEFRNLHRAYDGLRPAQPDALRLRAWCAGETGLPFVDACMRSLIATGWLNFRMRAMLMAVASYHLWLDWRRPGEHLARCFTDYEPGIHWPQVQMQSGTTGINTVRIYNPVKQGHDQDPTGAFVRRWLPELAPIEDRWLQEPWRAPNAARVLDRSYPRPIVDHLAAAKSAKAAIYGVRQGAEHRAGANVIQSKHGSRRSGIRPTGSKGQRARSRKTVADAQIELPLSDGHRSELPESSNLRSCE